MRNEKSDITIYDVAEVLNVSASTVSRALKDHQGIGKETKKKVKKMALAMGYEPNSIASNLRKKKTNTIGISQTHDSYEKEVENIKALYNSRVDGLIVSLAMQTRQYSHFDPFLKKGYPFVFADRVAYEMETDKIIIDNFKAAYDATVHLIGCGYKRIGH